MTSARTLKVKGATSLKLLQRCCGPTSAVRNGSRPGPKTSRPSTLETGCYSGKISTLVLRTSDDSSQRCLKSRLSVRVVLPGRSQILRFRSSSRSSETNQQNARMKPISRCSKHSNAITVTLHSSGRHWMRFPELHLAASPEQEKPGSSFQSQSFMQNMGNMSSSSAITMSLKRTSSKWLVHSERDQTMEASPSTPSLIKLGF